MPDRAGIAILLVLCAAIMHAGWNAVLARSTNRVATTRLMIFMHIIAGIILLQLASSSLLELMLQAWPWLIISAIGNILYWLGLGISYRHGEFSSVYGVIRGSVPILTTIGAVAAGQWPGPIAILAILLVSGGVCLLKNSGMPSPASPAIVWAIVTSIGTATAMLGDGLGVLSMADRIGFFGCSLLVTNLCSFATFSLIRLPSAPVSGSDLAHGMFAGFVAVATYGISIWAISFHSFGKIAALRETSVLFAMLIGWYFLGERFNVSRVLACTAIASGAVLLVALS